MDKQGFKTLLLYVCGFFLSLGRSRRCGCLGKRKNKKENGRHIRHRGEIKHHTLNSTCVLGSQARRTENKRDRKKSTHQLAHLFVGVATRHGAGQETTKREEQKKKLHTQRKHTLIAVWKLFVGSLK